MLVRELARLDAAAAPIASGDAGAPARSGGSAGSHDPAALVDSAGSPDSGGADRTWIDARRVPGHVAMAAAVRLASCVARERGDAIVSLTGVGALGILGSPVRSLADGGLVGVALANSAPIVAPWGGHGPAIGTNPIAAAAPRAGGPPLVVDFATSPTTVADLRRARARGADLDGPGGFDAAGHPVRAAADVRALAPAGRLGSLTGLVVELLAGIGAGGRGIGPEPAGRSALVIALDPGAHGGIRAAEVAAGLGVDWGAAGGHVPARFDSLPATLAAAPARLRVARAAVEALTGARAGRAGWTQAPQGTQVPQGTQTSQGTQASREGRS
nr:Ldh family oxidoreductase [Pseudactinotalea sp. HY160]